MKINVIAREPARASDESGGDYTKRPEGAGRTADVQIEVGKLMVDESRIQASIADILAKEVREQKLAEGQEIGKLVLLAEAKLGELFNQMPKATTNNPHGNNQFRSNSLREEIDPVESESAPADEAEPPAKPKLEVAKDMGFNKNQVADFQKLADNPAAVQKAIDDALKKSLVDDITSYIVTAIKDAVKQATSKSSYGYSA